METRRRIVAATFELHGDRGVERTSMHDIAAKAGVSVGTVYHHFPTYADAIAACGAYTAETVPAPDAGIFDGAATRPERIRRLVLALFDYYRLLPALSFVRREQHVSSALSDHAKQEADNRRRLAARALGLGARHERSRIVAALVDLEIRQALLDQGISSEAAADHIAALLNAWLDRADASSRP